jgi:hypothetical protein
MIKTLKEWGNVLQNIIQPISDKTIVNIVQEGTKEKPYPQKSTVWQGVYSFHYYSI